MQMSTYIRKTLYMGLFIVLSRVVKLQHTKKEHIKMNNRIIIRGLIIALVVSQLWLAPMHVKQTATQTMAQPITWKDYM